MEEIKIKGARLHNLKNIELAIAKNQLVVITGVSGSGKSTLAFDILFEEGKNQYLRSIGILSGLNNEDRFDAIEGIGPTVAVRQNVVRQNNPRSTVGSKLGLLNQLALVYTSDGQSLSTYKKHIKPTYFLYTTGEGMCTYCQGKGYNYEVNLERLIPDKGTSLLGVYEHLHVTSGFLKVLEKKYGTYFNEPFWEIPEEIRDEIVYGTYSNGKQSYCIERILRNNFEKGEDVQDFYEKAVCQTCHGERTSDETEDILLHGKRIGQLGQMTLTYLVDFLRQIPEEELSQFGKNVIGDMVKKLDHLIGFHLGHLTLYRELSSLSGGELQRLFLHLHLESRLNSLIYIFDEPMAGLHPLEKQNVVEAIKKLKDIGNTVIVVSHDREMIAHADHIIEIGPKAGAQGGNVVYQGNYQDYMRADTLLSRYLVNNKLMHRQDSVQNAMQDDKRQEPFEESHLILEHASTHYLKDLTVTFPLHKMVGVAGLSGSGKSSLITETLLKRLTSAKKYKDVAGLIGAQHIGGFVEISQAPIGRSSSSTPASYIGIWDKVRELFASQPEAKIRRMSAGHFSFHSKGACSKCGGSGYERIFLTSDFSVDKICPMCHGKRFNEESLSITYKGKTIADVLAMSVTQALTFFEGQQGIIDPLEILSHIGMGYITLGQPATSLSGGEAQRIKIAKQLGRQSKKNMLYILDEPTTGLSLYDAALLIDLLGQLVMDGNSVIVIEHSPEVLKACDYIIELGPEGGDKGGQIIAKGTPKQLISNVNSKIGRYLV